MVKKVDGLETYGFIISDYIRRLKVMRMIISGENQEQFANRIGIEPKRWNNYEQGYPISREVALMLLHKCPQVSIEWLWLGTKRGLGEDFRRKVEAFEHLEQEQEAARLALLQQAPLQQTPVPKKKRAAKKKASKK